MQIIEGNLLDVAEGIICHQVNCQGVMGSGIAKQIRERYPLAYDTYRAAFRAKHLWLGTNTYATPRPGFLIANLAAQDEYGRGVQQTNYDALNTCLGQLKQLKAYTMFTWPIYFPYNMSCDRGGGNWDIVVGMIEEKFPDAIIIRRNF